MKNNDNIMKEHELKKIDAEIANIMALSKKYGAETAKINKESRYYNFVVFGGILLALTSFIKVFIT